MASIQSELILLQYIGENIALFCGGLFSGATLYICLTERPPRTALGFADLLALSRANSGPTNAFLIALSALTALAAMIATVAGAGIWWFAGGLAHVAALFVLIVERAWHSEDFGRILAGAGPRQGEHSGGERDEA